MEHEVFVPVPVERLREALDDPARVARAVPGLQHDAGADPVARLKLRVGSHSITYRGSVRVSRRADGSYAVEGDAVETRGTGAVKLALRLRLRPLAAEGGAMLTVDGTATADGRVTELPADAVASAVARRLNRFAENLGTAVGSPPHPSRPRTSLRPPHRPPSSTRSPLCRPSTPSPRTRPGTAWRTWTAWTAWTTRISRTTWTRSTTSTTSTTSTAPTTPSPRRRTRGAR
ncbi:SRPBCC domain-containing protein [Streptomyces sp. INA 01156]